MRRFLLPFILLVLTGPLGLALLSGPQVRRGFHYMKNPLGMGITALGLGVLSIFLALGVLLGLPQLHLHLNLPPLLNPENLFGAYLFTGAVFCVSGLLVLARVEWARWMIIAATLLGFFLTAMPSLSVAEAMLDILEPMIASKFTALVPTGLSVFAGVMYLYYIRLTFAAVIILDLAFTVSMVGAAAVMETEAAFSSTPYSHDPRRPLTPPSL